MANVEFVSSDYIRVFPSIGRDPTYDGEASLVNEGNLSQIVRSLCRKRKSFVISENLNGNSFEFVIYGFYFRVLDPNQILTTRPLFAGIKIKSLPDQITDSSTSNYQLLVLDNSASSGKISTLDVDGSFEGVAFASSKEELSGYSYVLQLLDNDGNVPTASLLHYETSEILNPGSDSENGNVPINEVFETNSIITNSINYDVTMSIGVEDNTLVIHPPIFSKKLEN